MSENGWLTLKNFKNIENYIPSSVLENLGKITGAERIEIKSHDPVMTVKDVVRILKVPPSAILKSLFIKYNSDKVALVCTIGFNLIDIKKVRKILNDNKADLLPFKRISQYTAIPVGAISPLTYQKPPVILDPILSNLDTIYMGTGNNCTSFKVPIEVIKKLPFVRWIDITKLEK